MIYRGLLAGAAAAAVALSGCGDDSQGGADDSKPRAPKTETQPAVNKFADQLRGCLASGESRSNYGGAIGAKQAGDLEQTSVAAIESLEAKTDFFVFGSKAKAQRAGRQLGAYRQAGGKTEVRGLVLLAHKDELGNVGCLETARKAAGPALPDPPPAPAKLTAVDRQAVLKAGTVADYCADKEAELDSSAFPDDVTAEKAVRQFLPLLAEAPDVEVKMQDGYTLQSLREVGRAVADALHGPPPCLSAELAAQLKRER